MTQNPASSDIDKSKEANQQREQQQKARKNEAKKGVAKWLIVLGIALAATLAASTYLLEPMLPSQYVRYLQVAEIAVIGFFIIQVIGSISYRLAIDHSEHTAKSIKSIIRIAGAVIIIAFIISYLSQDPVIAASISTISGLVIGFAASNLIGNAIAGIYLAITRPFSIGDTITAFGNTGTVYDIGLLHTKLLMESGDIALSANSSLVTTTVIIRAKTSNDMDAQKKSSSSTAS